MRKKAKSINRGEHITKGDVFGDIGFEDPELSIIKMKAEVHSAILKIVRKNNFRSRDLEKILDIPQPRVSEILNGKISKFSLERLTKYLNLLGAKTMIRVDFGKTLKTKRRRQAKA